MAVYAVKKINLDKADTMEKYWELVKNASIKYCNGLDELRQYCGGKLHRERCGYAGIIGNIEYVAERVR